MNARMSAAGAWIVGFGLMAEAAFGAEQNLVKNGDFEKGRPGGNGPEGWEAPVSGREWVDLGGEHGRIVRFTIPHKIAISDGFKYFSDKFPIQEGRTYRCQVDIRTFGPSVVVFLQGLTTFRGQERQIYEKQIKSDKRVKAREWSTLDFEFTPQTSTAVSAKVLERRKLDLPHVEMLRVEFFGYSTEYYGYRSPDGGVVEFDNVRIVEKPAAAGNASTQPQSRPTGSSATMKP